MSEYMEYELTGTELEFRAKLIQDTRIMNLIANS